MLASLVLLAEPLQHAAIPADQGRALSALFLEWVARHDAALAARIHDADGVKPYTVSNLRGNARLQGQQRLLTPGTQVWWRITTLTQPLTALLLEALRLVLPEEITLGGHRLRLLGAASEQGSHPWAAQSTYQDLMQTYFLALRHPPATLDLEFASPTSFHSQGRHMPFPLPALLLRQWLEKWNAFAPTRFPDEFLSWAETCLSISRYRLESIPVRFGDITIIGCTGRCTLRALERDPYWERLLSTLAAFSFYCGSGVKTTFGLGQTRPLWRHSFAPSE